MSEKIIERITRLIEEKDMNDKDLCKLAGIKQSTFATWKQKGRNPQTEYIEKIANALDVSEKYLLTGEELDAVDQIMITVSNRPEMESLFMAAKDATKEEVEQIVKMIQTFKK